MKNSCENKFNVDGWKPNGEEEKKRHTQRKGTKREKNAPNENRMKTRRMKETHKQTPKICV